VIVLIPPPPPPALRARKMEHEEGAVRGDWGIFEAEDASSSSVGAEQPPRKRLKLHNGAPQAPGDRLRAAVAWAVAHGCAEGSSGDDLVGELSEALDEAREDWLPVEAALGQLSVALGADHICTAVVAAALVHRLKEDVAAHRCALRLSGVPTAVDAFLGALAGTTVHAGVVRRMWPQALRMKGTGAIDSGCDARIVRLLLDHKASPRGPVRGVGSHTPLWLACCDAVATGSLACVELLLARGADPDSRDDAVARPEFLSVSHWIACFCVGPPVEMGHLAFRVMRDPPPPARVWELRRKAALCVMRSLAGAGGAAVHPALDGARPLLRWALAGGHDLSARSLLLWAAAPSGDCTGSRERMAQVLVQTTAPELATEFSAAAAARLGARGEAPQGKTARTLDRLVDLWVCGEAGASDGCGVVLVRGFCERLLGTCLWRHAMLLGGLDVLAVVRRGDTDPSSRARHLWSALPAVGQWWSAEWAAAAPLHALLEHLFACETITRTSSSTLRHYCAGLATLPLGAALGAVANRCDPDGANRCLDHFAAIAAARTAEATPPVMRLHAELSTLIRLRRDGLVLVAVRPRELSQIVCEYL